MLSLIPENSTGIVYQSQQKKGIMPLRAPKNIVIRGKKITWDDMGAGISYLLRFEGPVTKTYEVTGNQIILGDEDLQIGDYGMSIASQDDNGTSPFSEKRNYQHANSLWDKARLRPRLMKWIIWIGAVVIATTVVIRNPQMIQGVKKFLTTSPKQEVKPSYRIDPINNTSTANEGGTGTVSISTNDTGSGISSTVEVNGDRNKVTVIQGSGIPATTDIAGDGWPKNVEPDRIVTLPALDVPVGVTNDVRVVIAEDEDVKILCPKGWRVIPFFMVGRSVYDYAIDDRFIPIRQNLKNAQEGKITPAESLRVRNNSGKPMITGMRMIRISNDLFDFRNPYIVR